MSDMLQLVDVVTNQAEHVLAGSNPLATSICRATTRRKHIGHFTAIVASAMSLARH